MPILLSDQVLTFYFSHELKHEFNQSSTDQLNTNDMDQAKC